MVDYTIHPSHGTVDSYLPFIGYRFTPKFDPVFTKDQTALLFKEIFACGNVSDIYIASDSPVTVQLKGQGIRSATPASLTSDQARQLIVNILGDDTAFSTIITREPIGGSVHLVIEQQQTSNVEVFARTQTGRNNTTTIGAGLTSNKQTTSFRWQLSGCVSQSTQGGFVFVMRPLASEPPFYKDLGIEQSFIDSFIQPDGICLMAGSTGQGKSTTLSATLRYLLENETLLKGAIVTIEDPIEIQYFNIKSKHSIVFQKQVGYGGHLKDFNAGVHSALRESPSLILVGELRNTESIKTALEASLTGHTVYATIHANNVGAILPRLLSQVDESEVGRILDSLRVLSAQKLVTLTTGKRTTVREWLVFTPELRDYLSKYIAEPLKMATVIRRIVDDGLLGAKNFKSQADDLRERGLIDDDNYKRLCVNETLDSSQIAHLDTLSLN